MKLKQQTTDKNDHRSSYAKVINQNGKLEQSELGVWSSYLRDPYHLMLTVSWSGFVLIVSVGYIVINVIFALLFLAGDDCLAGARPGSFPDAFFFSVQTLASIGYGAISPKTLYANGVVTLEAISSLLVIAVVTGLSFARFSKPNARIIFSDVAVVMPHNNVPTLVFRAANKRRNQIVEARITVDLAIDEVSEEGEAIRRFYELPLLRQRTSSFNLAWTVRHVINQNSPLYNLTPEMLTRGHAAVIVSLVGIDETVAYTINARQNYSAREILWNHRFVDMLTIEANGDRYLDYQHFHSVSPIT
ncbi:MAG: ion channel [Methylococcales bacterium]|nr:ion channel [Methylococcales bacterium]